MQWGPGAVTRNTPLKRANARPWPSSIPCGRDVPVIRKPRADANRGQSGTCTDQDKPWSKLCAGLATDSVARVVLRARCLNRHAHPATDGNGVHNPHGRGLVNRLKPHSARSEVFCTFRRSSGAPSGDRHRQSGASRPRHDTISPASLTYRSVLRDISRRSGCSHDGNHSATASIHRSGPPRRIRDLDHRDQRRTAAVTAPGNAPTRPQCKLNGNKSSTPRVVTQIARLGNHNRHCFAVGYLPPRDRLVPVDPPGPRGFATDAKDPPIRGYAHRSIGHSDSCHAPGMGIRRACPGRRACRFRFGRPSVRPDGSTASLDGAAWRRATWHLSACPHTLRSQRDRLLRGHLAILNGGSRRPPTATKRSGDGPDPLATTRTRRTYEASNIYP